MEKIAVSELSTIRWSLEQDVTAYREAGFDAIGVWRHKLSDCDPFSAANLIRNAGMKVSSLQWAGGFTGTEVCNYDECVEDGREAIIQASILGADCLIVHIGGRCGHTANHARRLAKGALKNLVTYAKEHRVRLAIEPMHPRLCQNWTFCDRLQSALDLIHDFPAEHVGIVFDSYHLGYDRCAVEALESITDRIALIQIADGRKVPGFEPDRCLPGNGTLPVAEIIEVAQSSGYDGFFELELMGPEFDNMDYGSMLNLARQATEQVFQEAGSP